MNLATFRKLYAANVIAYAFPAVVGPCIGTEQHLVPLGAVQAFAPAIATTTSTASNVIIISGASAYHPNAMGDEAIAAPLWWQQLNSMDVS